MRAIRVLLLLALVLPASAASARELWSSEDGEYSLELGSTLKGTWLLSRAPDDPLLYPERTSGATLWRLRFDPTATLSEWVTVAAAYEHGTRMTSGSGAMGAGAGILPPDTDAPYRLRPLDWTLVDQPPTLTHAHEIDRAFVAVHLPFAEVTLGRQAIGMGRGVIFSAVDLFSPFSPLEVDREWRRGVDAARADVRFLRGLSADVTAAFDRDLEDSVVVGRLRGYVGDLDGAVLFGRRAEDDVVGATLSAVVGDAELHGEFAEFGTDGRGIDGGWLGTERVVAKAVAGGSYNFDVGNGLRLLAEYHYSGFGVHDIEDATLLLLDPDFQARLARGDTQILGRHAVGALVSYDVLDELTAALTWLQSPVDGSGMVVPSLQWFHSDGVTLVGSVFVPWGETPEDARFRSEYGAAPFSVFLQASIYD